MFYLFEELMRIRMKEVSEEVKGVKRKPIRSKPQKKKSLFKGVKMILHSLWKREGETYYCQQCDPCCQSSL